MPDDYKSVITFIKYYIVVVYRPLYRLGGSTQHTTIPNPTPNELRLEIYDRPPVWRKPLFWSAVIGGTGKQAINSIRTMVWKNPKVQAGVLESSAWQSIGISLQASTANDFVCLVNYIIIIIFYFLVTVNKIVFFYNRRNEAKY